MSIMRSFILGMLLVMTGMASAYASYSTAPVTKADAKAYAKIENYVLEAENKTGVDANLIAAILMIESNFGANTHNPYNPHVGGAMQHSRNQWRSDVKKHSQHLGLSAKVSVNNKRASILIGAAGLADNRAYLEQRTRRNVTDGDVYMSWFVGLYGAERIMKGSPNAKISKYVRITKGNWKLYTVNGKIATVQQFRNKMNSLVSNTKNKVDNLVDQTRMDNFVQQFNEGHNAGVKTAMLY